MLISELQSLIKETLLELASISNQVVPLVRKSGIKFTTNTIGKNSMDIDVWTARTLPIISIISKVLGKRYKITTEPHTGWSKIKIRPKEGSAWMNIKLDHKMKKTDLQKMIREELIKILSEAPGFEKSKALPFNQFLPIFKKQYQQHPNAKISYPTSYTGSSSKRGSYNDAIKGLKELDAFYKKRNESVKFYIWVNDPTYIAIALISDGAQQFGKEISSGKYGSLD